MSPEERREMRRVQVEQYLASGMRIRTWCKLNRVPSSTLYYWVDYFRNHEPEMFDSPTRKEWIELSRDSTKAKSALAVVNHAAPSPAPRDDSTLYSDGINCSPIVVNLPQATITIPPHTQKTDIQKVIEVIANL